MYERCTSALATDSDRHWRRPHAALFACVCVGQAARSVCHCRFSRHCCDIFECTPADLLTTTASDARVRKTGAASLPIVVALDRSVRPRRANILDE